MSAVVSIAEAIKSGQPVAQLLSALTAVELDAVEDAFSSSSQSELMKKAHGLFLAGREDAAELVIEVAFLIAGCRPRIEAPLAAERAIRLRQMMDVRIASNVRDGSELGATVSVHRGMRHV